MVSWPWAAVLLRLAWAVPAGCVVVVCVPGHVAAARCPEGAQRGLFRAAVSGVQGLHQGE